LTIVWNSNGFHLIDAMPTAEEYSVQWNINNILTPICQRLIPAGKCILVIHADNSRCHTATIVLNIVPQRKVRSAPDPPYSPDIAPTDFVLFGGLKRELRGSRFQTADKLLAKIRKLVGEISFTNFRRSARNSSVL
jgi:hypothetical protein